MSLWLFLYFHHSIDHSWTYEETESKLQVVRLFPHYVTLSYTTGNPDNLQVQLQKEKHIARDIVTICDSLGSWYFDIRSLDSPNSMQTVNANINCSAKFIPNSIQILAESTGANVSKFRGLHLDIWLLLPLTRHYINSLINWWYAFFCDWKEKREIVANGFTAITWSSAYLHSRSGIWH